MKRAILGISALALGLVSWQAAVACHVAASLRYSDMTPQQKKLLSHGGMEPEAIAYTLKSATACVGGFADIFPCDSVDLLAHLPLSSIGGGSGNDLWGWTDPQTGKEYALTGRSTGTAFVDISDAENPVYLGNLPTHSVESAWRDIKVYRDHAFIVADWASNHGMQVFDLTQLRGVTNPPVTFTNTAHYPGFARAHNVVINPDSGFAYAVGGDTCSGGPHMIDVQDPVNPSFVGCFSGDAYTHDAQCVTYAGPDGEHQGKEICFNANEDTLTIVDVTDKSNPVQISRTGYGGSGYTHQGWLTEDHAHFVLDDEADEGIFGHNTKTYLWDLTDLDSPAVGQTFLAAGSSIDHNQYVRGGFAYQANYKRGLRILQLPVVTGEGGAFDEIAFFDTYPEEDSTGFRGAWSAFPYFDSGVVIVSDINRGLFILKPNLVVETPLFADGFESGDMTGWSIAMP